MAVTELIVITVGMLLAAGAVFYGCITVPPGAWLRWLVFGAVAIIATQFVWWPLVSAVGWADGVSVLDQYAAVGIATLEIKFLVERVIPRWL